MKWKPFKWWILCLIALVLALWISGAPAQADPTEQAAFKIGGDLTIATGQTVTDAFAIGGDLTLQPGAVVEGDAFAIGGDVQLKENVQVGGDSFAVGGKMLREPSAKVDGNQFTVLEQLSDVFERVGVFGTLYLANVIFWLIGFVAAAVSGLLFLMLLPSHVEIISSVVRTRPLHSFRYSIGGLLSISLIAALLGGSALGAVVIPLINLAAVFTGLLGLAASCIWLGHRVHLHNRKNKTKAPFQHFSLGLLLLFFISLIPFFGGVLVSLFGLFGFGAALLSQYGTGRAASRAFTDKIAPTDRLETQRLEHQME